MSGASVKNTQNNKTATDVLDPTEERLLRMKEGQTVADDQPLQQMGVGHADTMAKLRELELEAFVATDRVEELRRGAGVTTEAADPQMKNKIIGRLSDDAAAGSANSQVAAEIVSNATNKKDH